MWKSALSISKVCGKGGKTASWFSQAFHGPGISAPASVVTTLRRQASPPEHSPIRFRIQLGWHSTVSSACVFGYTRAATRWFHPWPDGSFQSAGRAAVPPSASRKRLRAGVVPAVSLAAHRGHDGIFFEHFVELVAGVLAAAIAMEDQLVVLIRTALEPCHLQGIDHNVAWHVGLHRPAHHMATEQIDYYSKKQPAFLGSNVSDVAGPILVRRGRGKVAIQKVGRNRQIEFSICNTSRSSSRLTIQTIWKLAISRPTSGAHNPPRVSVNEFPCIGAVAYHHPVLTNLMRNGVLLECVQNTCS